jgi:hypothetical protein
MTDILDLVTQDEVSVPLEIKGKKDGKEVKTGVIFNVRDLHNLDTQKELKKERNRNMGQRLLSKQDIDPEELGAMFYASTTEPTDSMLAHCVTSWEWGDKTLGDIKTEYSHANVIAALNAAPWIRQQVLAKALEVTDFTRA